MEFLTGVSALYPRALCADHQQPSMMALARPVKEKLWLPVQNLENVEAPTIAEGSAAKRQVFTRDEVASLLRLSVDTVNSEIKRGKLKAFKRGRHVGSQARQCAPPTCAARDTVDSPTIEEWLRDSRRQRHVSFARGIHHSAKQRTEGGAPEAAARTDRNVRLGI